MIMTDIIDKYYDILNSTFVYYNGTYWGNPNINILIMSMTKSFIAICYGYMFLDKLLKPSDKVSKYILDYNNLVTFDELLTHTSGIVDDEFTYSMYKSKDIIQFCIDRPIQRNMKTKSTTKI
jgi:CubicO group peptidase (beta-lactamase class C family)